ncbi:hypothetical protein GCM10023083_73170 [Streptomyces phyllanthi]
MRNIHENGVRLRARRGLPAHVIRGGRLAHPEDGTREAERGLACRERLASWASGYCGGGPDPGRALAWRGSPGAWPSA